MLKEKEKAVVEKDAVEQNQLTSEVNEQFDEATFEKVYNDYIQLLDKTAKSRISSFLKNSKYKLLDNAIVELELRSKLELELLEEDRLDLIPFFRSGLKNSNFDFKFFVNSDLIQQTKKVSKQDLLKIMSDKNPLVSDLVQGLGLEIEY